MILVRIVWEPFFYKRICSIRVGLRYFRGIPGTRVGPNEFREGFLTGGVCSVQYGDLIHAQCESFIFALWASRECPPESEITGFGSENHF